MSTTEAELFHQLQLMNFYWLSPETQSNLTTTFFIQLDTRY